MPTISEVRTYLNEITEDRVADSVILESLEIAKVIVEQEKSEAATPKLIELAVLTLAGYHTYKSYATEVERRLGYTPAPILQNLELLRRSADRFISYIRRGKMVFATPAAMSGTLSIQLQPEPDV